MGHLGSRVSALLDGHLPPAEEERAWEHVHACHPCRDLVEREGWVKTRLAELSYGTATAPPTLRDSLRQSLLAPSPDGTSPMQPQDALLATGLVTGRPRPRHLAALGGSALGVAVLGVLALGAVPANAPQNDRRPPVTSLVPPSPTAYVRPAPQRPRRTPSVRPPALRETTRVTMVP